MNEVKARLFAIEELCHGTELEQKQGKRFIKGLNQVERFLALEILQGRVTSRDEQIHLNQALGKGDGRSTSFKLDCVRGWKNGYCGRIKSSFLFKLIYQLKMDESETRVDYQDQLAELKKLVSYNEINKRLEFFQSNPLCLDDLIDFLRINATDLSFYAFKDPLKWSFFSKKMIKKIEKKMDQCILREDYKIPSLNRIKNLFDRLDLVHAPSVEGMQRFSLVKGALIPKEILHLIAANLPFTQSSLKIMQLLYRDSQDPSNSVLRSINAEGLAQYLVINHISLPDLALSFDDMREVVKFLPEIDLISFGIKEKLSIPYTKKLHVPRDMDLKYVGIFKALEELSFDCYSSFEGIKKYLKLPCLKSLKFNNCNVPKGEGFEWIQSLPCLENLVVWVNDRDLRNAKFSSCVTELKLSFCANIPYESFQQLLKLKSLSIVYSPITPKDLAFLGCLPALSRFECSRLPKKGIEFLTNLVCLTVWDKISKENLIDIGNLFNLEELKLHDHKFTNEEVTFLATSLPRLRTIFSDRDGYINF